MAENEIETLRTIEKAARTRYRALDGVLARAAEASAIAPDRFAGGETIVAEHQGEPAGFLLLRPLDGLAYVVNIAVSLDAAGLGIGRLLMTEAEQRARQLKLAGLSLTTFRVPPWNGPWFRRQSYSSIPEELVGPGLRTILDRHAIFHDMATRETLWKPIALANQR
jgi:GNAT superfamily N-acetyltransferase